MAASGVAQQLDADVFSQVLRPTNGVPATSPPNGSESLNQLDRMK